MDIEGAAFGLALIAIMMAKPPSNAVMLALWAARDGAVMRQGRGERRA